MYCECFSKGLICGKDCICTGCQNLDGKESSIQNAREEILIRNPKAFESKIIEKT